MDRKYMMPGGMVLGLLALIFTFPAAVADQPVAAKLPVGVTLQQTEIGSVFADKGGLTAYVFDKDAKGDASACNGNCAKAWPPLTAPADAKPLPGWTVISREDGSEQWAYKGKPLYTFAQWDAKPGDLKGDNVGSIWHAARP